MSVRVGNFIVSSDYAELEWEIADVIEDFEESVVHDSVTEIELMTAIEEWFGVSLSRFSVRRIN